MRTTTPPIHFPTSSEYGPIPFPTSQTMSARDARGAPSETVDADLRAIVAVADQTPDD